MDDFGQCWGVSALSGYMAHPDSRVGQVIFSIIVNNNAIEGTYNARATIDAMVVELAGARQCPASN